MSGERIDLGDLLWTGTDEDVNAMRAAFWDRDWYGLEGAVKRLLARAAAARPADPDRDGERS